MDASDCFDIFSINCHLPYLFFVVLPVSAPQQPEPKAEIKSPVNIRTALPYIPILRFLNDFWQLRLWEILIICKSRFGLKGIC